MAEKGVADNPILITPRTLAGIITAVAMATIGAYIWIFSTFVTIASFDAHANDFQQYIEGQNVRMLQLALTDAKDKLWELEVRMDEPGGDNLTNQKRKHELQQRIDDKESTIHCLQNNGEHCLKMETS